MRGDRLIARLPRAWYSSAPRASPATPGSAYPSRPIECVIPFAPGGPTDTAIRLIQPQLSANLGVPRRPRQQGGRRRGHRHGRGGQGQAGRLHAGRHRALHRHDPARHPARRHLQARRTSPWSAPMPSTRGWCSSNRDSPWKTLEELVDVREEESGQADVRHGGARHQQLLHHGAAQAHLRTRHDPRALRRLGAGEERGARRPRPGRRGLAEPHALGAPERRRGGPRHQRDQADRRPSPTCRP